MTNRLLFLIIFVYQIKSGICQGERDPTNLTSVPLGIGLDPEVIEPIIKLSESFFSDLTKDLSLEEAVESFPEIFNETAYGSPGDNVVQQYGFTPIFEGILRSPNGTQIALQVVQDSDLVVQTFFILLSNFDLQALADANMFDQTITNWALVFLVPLLQPPFTEYVTEIIVQLTVSLVTSFPDGVESAKAVMEPLLDTLESTGDLSGVFLDLSGLAVSDSVSNFLAQALETSEFELVLDPQVVSKLVGDFLAEFQKALDLDDPQLLQLILDVFKEILNNLP